MIFFFWLIPLILWVVCSYIQFPRAVLTIWEGFSMTRRNRRVFGLDMELIV